MTLNSHYQTVELFSIRTKTTLDIKLDENFDWTYFGEI